MHAAEYVLASDTHPCDQMPTNIPALTSAQMSSSGNHAPYFRKHRTHSPDPRYRIVQTSSEVACSEGPRSWGPWVPGARPPLAVTTPYTLNPAPYTLHPTPCTLHPTPCTLHPTPYTMHHAPYALHPSPYTLHSTPCKCKSICEDNLVPSMAVTPHPAPCVGCMM